jgi:hypothetical protein
MSARACRSRSQGWTGGAAGGGREQRQDGDEFAFHGVCSFRSCTICCSRSSRCLSRKPEVTRPDLAGAVDEEAGRHVLDPELFGEISSLVVFDPELSRNLLQERHRRARDPGRR